MGSLVRSTVNRAVHVRITPRPSNLGESREILRLISQFGEVEYFRSLKFDAIPGPNAALVIFKDEEAAAHCLKRDPIRFRMGRAPIADVPDRVLTADADDSTPEPPTRPANSTTTGPESAPFGLGQTRSMSTRTLPDPPPRPIQIPFQSPPQPILEARLFQLEVNPARAHFRDQINLSHYHGPFELHRRGMPEQDLAQRVPLPGLSCVDWKAVEKPWRVVTKEKEREHGGLTRRKSLKEVYDEGNSEV